MLIFVLIDLRYNYFVCIFDKQEISNSYTPFIWVYEQILYGHAAAVGLWQKENNTTAVNGSTDEWNK